MSAQLKEGDQVKGTDGKQHALKSCQTCKQLFYFEDNPKKTEPDQKPYVRKNPDGSEHKDQQQGFRKPSYKFSWAVGKMETVLTAEKQVGVRIELMQEFPQDIAKDVAFKQVCEQVDTMLAREKAKQK